MTETKNELVKAEFKPLTPAEITEQVNTIQRVMKAVMLRETHYDVLPGCGNKPVLLKPGAEKILTTFHIGVETIVEDLSDGFDFRYRVTCRGFYIPTGNTVGYGIGEASTSEKKYKWREAVCQEEYDDTPETQRQILYKKDRNGNVFKTYQVRQNPADLANTCLKMAKKRAMVDLCLTSTACSDIFAQDIDDPDTAETNNINTQPRYQQPQKKSATTDKNAGNAPISADIISDAQRKRLYAIGSQKGLSVEEMSFICFDVAGVNRSDEIPRRVYDEVVAAYEAAIPGQVITE